jgi:hypothetical protein
VYFSALVCRLRRARTEGKNPKSCDEVFERLITEGTHPDDLYHEVTHQVRHACECCRISQGCV